MGSGTGCSSTTSSGGGGSSGGGSGGGSVLPPDAFMSTVVGGGPDCPFATPVTNFLSVGTDTQDKPTTVTNQGSTGSGTATVSCSVHPSGNGFDILLSLSVSGAQGGSVTITSPAGAGAVTASGGSGITASFTSAVDQGPFESSACTLTYTYLGQPVPVNPTVAAGRIWGHIDCPGATEAGHVGIGPDGGTTPIACDASADFLFEQCQM
jgi:hypothetical protein